METYYTAQTPLIWQEDPPQDSLWPHQANNINTDFNTNYNNTTTDASMSSIGLDCLEFDLDFQIDMFPFQLDPHIEEDSLKSDIESISSCFMPGESSPSNSSDSTSTSLLDQGVISESSGDEVASESPGNKSSCLKRVQSNSGRVNKRESNKVAAVRYRAKKVKEREALFRECDEMAARNSQLRLNISEIEQEIGFIKNLLVQALHAKIN